MSDKPEDKFIDELFRDSVDNIETEPSDHFWNKAYDSILQKENSAYTKRLWRLRGVVMVLGLAVAGLIGYNAYTTIKLSNIVDRMAGLEKQQAGKNDVRTNDRQTAVNSVNANTVVAVNSQPGSEKNAQHGISPNTERNNTLVASANTSHRYLNQRQFHLTASSNSNASSSQTVAYNNASLESRKASAQSVKQGINNIIYLEEKPLTIPPQDKSDSNLLAMDIDDEQSTVKPIAEENEAQLLSDKPKFIHKLSVSAYFAPSIADPVLKSNDQNTGNINPSDIKSREHEQFAYATGANLSYDITNRLTVQLGCEYRNYKFSLDPTTVDASSGELNSGYPYVTSSGTVYMPYITGYTPFGYYDTVATAKGTATRSYLSIPLNLKYYFVDKPKFGFYLTGGGSMNILTSNYATVHCQNSWGEEDLYLYDVQGARTINFSGIFGLGATFELGHGISMFIQPSYSAAITPNTSNSPITVYSNYFDVAGGISYHF